MFIENKRFMSFILAVLSLLLLFTLSSVSAAEYNLTSGATTEEFQDAIDNDLDNELVINLGEGSYGFNQINVTRNATIIGKDSSTLITGTDSEILFKITASNVKIINLTISNY